MHVSQDQPSGGTEPEPAGRTPRSLYVPVRRGPAGTVLRLWRTPFGTRTAVAFTSDRRLRSVLGPCQPWIRLSEAALRGMAEPLGARHLTVDPLLTARPPAAWSGTASGVPCAPRATRPQPAGTA
ncbi:SAV_915 family protein [Streptomyces sp.]|uniref:SAV_915 family protein n=1 Tax=Streptomyces sp. TaxID=1931 RepID=UPI002F41723A